MLTDAQALKDLRRDPEAICVLYDRHLAALVRYLARVGASPEVAWDVAQETFARLLTRGYRGRLESDESAWPWLAVTSRNLLRDWQRRGKADESARRRAGIAVVDSGEDDLEDALARLDSDRQSRDIEAALESLPSPQKAAVIGRVVDEKGYDTLAEDACETEQTMRGRVSRGLRFMRAMIEEAKA
jgi:RNA polymerase sigma-70 factor (ECF subfamily)